MLVHYTQQNLFHAGDLTLKPGLNEIEKAHWDQAQAYPMFKEKMKSGHIKQLKDGEKLSEPEDFHSKDDADALQMVKDCADEQMLMNWQSKEKRKPVLAAIKAQLKKIDEA